MNKLNIIFIGGLTNGKVVLNYLLSNKNVSIPLLITHPQEYVGPRHVRISKTIKGVEVINDLDAKLEPAARFLNEVGVKEVSSQPKLSITRSRLPSDTQVVLLEC